MPDTPFDDRRFTIKNPHTDAVYAGLEHIPADNGCLMRAKLAPGETRAWHSLEIGESTNLRENLIVVRVR